MLSIRWQDCWLDHLQSHVQSLGGTGMELVATEALFRTTCLRTPAGIMSLSSQESGVKEPEQTDMDYAF